MKNVRITAAALLVSMVALAGCTGTPALEITTNPPAPETASPPSETPAAAAPVEAERGTRANPLAVGEARKISEESMWIVSAEAATEVAEGYVVLPLRLGMDWEASRQQTVDAGGDANAIDNEGVNPYYALSVTFVTANGRSYTTLDDYSVEVGDPEFFEIGTLFPPAESVSARQAVSVPSEEIAGGVWMVQNQRGDSVYLSQ